MIAAQLGLSMTVLSETTYSMIVFVVVATALATPLLLRYAFAGVTPAPAAHMPDASK